MQKIVVEQDFEVPVERAFAFLSEHENLANLFPAKIKRISDGSDGRRNGVGSARSMRIAVLPPFVETNTNVVDNELVEYKITKGSPLKDHYGQMKFSSRDGGGSKLRYEIGFNMLLPGVGFIIAKALESNVKKGLKKVDKLA